MTEERLAAWQGRVKDLPLEKEREGGGFPVPEAQKESRQLEFIVTNSHHKVKGAWACCGKWDKGM